VVDNSQVVADEKSQVNVAKVGEAPMVDDSQVAAYEESQVNVDKVEEAPMGDDSQVAAYEESQVNVDKVEEAPMGDDSQVAAYRESPVIDTKVEEAEVEESPPADIDDVGEAEVEEAKDVASMSAKKEEEESPFFAKVEVESLVAKEFPLLGEESQYGSALVAVSHAVDGGTRDNWLLESLSHGDAGIDAVFMQLMPDRQPMDTTQNCKTKHF
jgi:hypothetical protein